MKMKITRNEVTLMNWDGVVNRFQLKDKAVNTVIVQDDVGDESLYIVYMDGDVQFIKIVEDPSSYSAIVEEKYNFYTVPADDLDRWNSIALETYGRWRAPHERERIYKAETGREHES